MKKNIEYYQHYVSSHNHPKFKMLRIKYGWEGEGKFWALNNMIGQSESCKLNLKKGYNKAIVCSELQFTPEEFEIYLQYLSKDCRLIIYKNGVISTEITQENYAKVHGDRVGARKRYERKNKNFGGDEAEKIKTSGENSKTSVEKIYKSNQTKLNKIKLNKIKPKEIKEIKENSEGQILNKKDLLEGKSALNGKANEYFEKFWKFYNRREGKIEDVKAIFDETIKTEENYKQLIAATRNYNNLTRGRPLEFVKLPLNFILTYKDFIKVDN